MVAGPDFGSVAGNNMLVRNFLYILKISGAAFRAFLAGTTDTIGNWPSYVNPYL